jgi:hypothetical protein
LENSNLDSGESSTANTKGSRAPSVRTARWLFVILGVIWLVFGTWSILRIDGSGGEISWTILILIAVLMILNSAILIWISWGIGKGKRWYYYFGLIVLTVNILLTLTDEFGVFDLIVLLIAIGLFILLVATRSNYLRN